MWQSIGIWFDMMLSCGDSRMSQHHCGRFHIIYDCGGKSMPMDYSTAKDYTEIFDGSVYHSATNNLCYTAKKSRAKL